MKSSESGVPLHLGILQTDHVLSHFQGEFGDYPDMFAEVFRAVDPTLQFTTYDVEAGIPEAVICDAYIITGSRHSVYDDLPWIPGLVAFLQTVLAADKKILGICFGHQLMAHFFGGRVASAGAWGVGVHTSQVVQPAAWMQPPSATIRLLCSHKDQVLEVPAGAQVFASSDFCPVAGFTLGDRVITTQGHPEFVTGYSQGLMQHRAQAIGAETLQRGLASLSEPTNEHLLIRWMLNFVQGNTYESS